MDRAVLPIRKRVEFFAKLLAKSDAKILAKKYRISTRTLRDWKRGKFYPDVDILKNMAKDFGIKLPPFKILPTYWYVKKYARNGALARMKKYGPPGTPEGRKKGGQISQQKRRENPEYYKQLGCIVPKTFAVLKQDEATAELFGILLGDGGITKDQIRISLDRVADRDYVAYVARLMKKVIGEKPTYHFRTSTTDLMLSGVGLIQVLEQMGLQRGSKIVHQVKIPDWIMTHDNLKFACLRGLFDTDGGFYIHHHSNTRNKWTNLGWSFTNHSLPLVIGCKSILETAGIVPHGDTRRVYLYSVGAMRKFMEIIGSSNPKNIDKYERYMREFYTYEWKNRKGAGAV